MIGQFRGLYFTVRPAKFKSLFELRFPPFIWTQIYNKYLPNLVLVRTASYRTSFFFSLGFMPHALYQKYCFLQVQKKWATWVNFCSVIAFFFFTKFDFFCGYFVWTGVTTVSPDQLKFPHTMTDLVSGAWMVSGSSVLQNGSTSMNGYACDLDKLEEGSRLGIMRKSSGSLHFFVNGQDCGVAASSVPSGNERVS